MVELFQAKSMTEAKKIINRSSPDVQKVVESILDKEVKEANKVLKDKTDELLEPWKNIDGRTFNTNYV